MSVIASGSIHFLSGKDLSLLQVVFNDILVQLAFVRVSWNFHKRWASCFHPVVLLHEV